jgi:hypothetical protein
VVAWYATTISPARRRLFRIVLGTLLIVQAAAVALDRGELHREAIAWLSAQHTVQEKVLVSSSAINTFAFSYLGFPHPECLVSVGDGARKKKKDRALINEAIKRLFAQEKRGFLFLYHDRLDLDDRLKELNQTGFIKARRRLGVNRSVTVIAFIRDDSERAWLAALPEIPHPWGPSRADEPKGSDQGDSE